MQRFTQHWKTVVIGLVGGVVLWAGSSGLSYANHFPAENVSITKHNLSANPNIQFGSTSTFVGSSEVCVFCHTPHGAGYKDQLGVGMAPLWNRKINLSTNYTTYDDPSFLSPHFDSAATLNQQIKGVSLACLSCHDGTIAFDALINLQGSGGLQASNLTQNPSGGSVAADHALADTLFNGFGGEAVDSTAHTFKAGTRGNDPSGNPFGGSLYSNDTLDASGANGTAPFPNLTNDLRDDHPISFEIPAGSVDPQFSELELGSVAEPSNSKLLYLRRRIGGNPGVYPVDKRDRIRAYTSNPAKPTVSSGSVSGAYIECASCHNPHTPRTLFLRLPSNVLDDGHFGTTGTGLPSGGLDREALDVDPAAVRTYWSHAPNQGSAICLSCHQK